MANTGAVFPQTAASVSETPWVNDTWQNPGNVTANDTAYATIVAPTYDANDDSYKLRATNFNFSTIPDNSTINGITVVCGGVKWVAGTASIGLLQLVNNGTPIGNNKYSTVQAVTSSDVNYTKGSTSDLWNATLTAAIVKSSTFGVDFGMIANSANTDVSINYITMAIEYTPPAPQTYNAYPVDSFTATDTIFRTIGKVLSETSAFTDATLSTVGKSLLESTTYTDTLAVLIESVLLDSAIFTDTFEAVVEKEFTDTIGFSDELTFELILASNIMLRAIKGSALTQAEIDGNLTYLNSTKLEYTPIGINE